MVIEFAFSCESVLKDKGIRIPQDMDVMAFGGYPFSQIIEPKLTEVDIKVRSMGSQAAKHLVDIIRHPNMQIQTYVTTSNVIERESTR